MARTTKGRIFQRGKTWYVQYYLAGRQIVQTLRTTDKREAQRLADERLAGLRIADKAEQAKAAASRLSSVEDELTTWKEEHRPRLALADVWPKYLAARNRPQSGAHTLADYARQWERFATWMGKNCADQSNAEDVTPEDAGAFLLYLEDAKAGPGLGPNRYNKAIQALRLIFRVITPHTAGKPNPFTDCQPKPLEPERHRELSEAELTKVCTAATGELRTLLALGLYCGFRIASAATLQWNEVDMTAGVIVHAPPKTIRRTGKRVAVPIHPTLAAILAETPPEQRAGPLLPELCESYRRDNGCKIAKIIREHFKTCGIASSEKLPGRKKAVARATFHSLRHSLVSALARRGVPLASVRELVGHTSEAVQRAYLHTTAEDMRQAINAMPSATAAPALPPGDDAAAEAEAIRARLAKLLAAAPLDVLKKWEAVAKMQPLH